MTIQEKIEEILQKKYSPTYLRVENKSDLHKNHAGDDGSGETHFRIEITTSVFKKYNRLECHRMIYKSLNKLMNNPIHALEIDIKN